MAFGLMHLGLSCAHALTNVTGRFFLGNVVHREHPQKISGCQDLECSGCNKDAAQHPPMVCAFSSISGHRLSVICPVCNSAVLYMTSIAPASRVSICQLRDGESVASLAHRCGKGPDALRYDPPKDVFTADASTVQISALCAQATDV